MNKTSSFHQSGSSILTIMIIITLITILCLNMWRMTVVAHDVALKKQSYEQHIQPLNGIMIWALDICRNNFELVFNYAITRKEGVHIEIPSWNINQTIYAVDLVFKNKGTSTLSIAAQLLDKKKPVAHLTCLVSKLFIEDSPVYKVDDWSSYEA
jgi:hypothetical protein